MHTETSEGTNDMAEFLVNISFHWDDRVTDEQREQLRVEERARAAELAAEGRLVRMWRVPGRRENWGLWRANDATHLHETLTSMPIWPWMDIKVIALADHAVDPGAKAAAG